MYRRYQKIRRAIPRMQLLWRKYWGHLLFKRLRDKIIKIQARPTLHAEAAVVLVCGLTSRDFPPSSLPEHVSDVPEEAVAP